MNNNKDKKNVVNSFIVFLIVLYKYLLNFNNISKYVLYLCIILITILTFISLFKIKYSKKSFFLLMIFLLLSVIFMIENFSVNFLFIIYLALLFYKEKDYKTLAKYFFISLIICFIGTIILYIFGLIPDHIIYRRVDGVIKKRISLGFIHPNSVFLYYLGIVLSYYYAFSPKSKKFIFIVIVSSYILYTLTLSRTGLLCIVVFLIMHLIKKEGKFIKKIIPHVFLLFTITTLILIALFNNYGFDSLNELFSGRLYYYYYYIQKDLLFQPFGSSLIAHYTIDNYYLVIFLYTGYIGYLIFLLINYISFKELKNDLNFSIVVFIFLLYGIFESNTIVSSVNFTLVIQFLVFLKVITKQTKVGGA